MQLRGILMLADSVEEVGGKLYLLGAGWTKILEPDKQVRMGIAVKLRGPRTSVTEAIPFTIQLLDQENKLVRSGLGGNRKKVAVEISGRLQPRAGASQQDEHDGAIAANVVVTLAAGQYRWELRVGEEVLADWPFTVLGQLPATRAKKRRVVNAARANAAPRVKKRTKTAR